MSSTSDSNKVVLARLLMPDDANISGNVHGGTILQLMEQAGMIAATRHFNSDPDHEHHEKQVAGLARFETMSFHEPVFVGEIASLTTALMFTSERSLLIKVSVSAENAATGKTRLTNTGMMWYLSFVPSQADNKKEQHCLTTVPQLIPPTDPADKKAYQKGKALYDARKQAETAGASDCLKIDGCLCPSCRTNFTPAEGSHPPAESTQTLCQMVLPGDCGTSNVAFGGFVMKLMDTAAGCCAFRHARTNIVTISISAMDFDAIVHLGDIVTIEANMRFCSSKSMEIMVVAKVTSMTKQDHVVARGTFTFVALDKKNKVIAVPGLALETEEEFDHAFASQVKYEAAKQARIAAAAARAKK